MAGQVTTQPLSPELGVIGWGQQPPAVHPEPSRGLGEATGRSSLQRPHRWGTAGEGGRTGQDRLADRVLQGQRAAMAGWGRQARAQGLELVVQPLLEGLAVGTSPRR